MSILLAMQPPYDYFEKTNFHMLILWLSFNCFTSDYFKRLKYDRSALSDNILDSTSLTQIVFKYSTQQRLKII